MQDIIVQKFSWRVPGTPGNFANSSPESTFCSKVYQENSFQILPQNGKQKRLSENYQDDQRSHQNSNFILFESNFQHNPSVNDYFQRVELEEQILWSTPQTTDKDG